MKTGEQILSVRKQTGIKLLNEELWPFSENGEVNRSQVIDRNSFGGNRISSYNEAYKSNLLESSERNRNKMQCSFIVDWQMPDTF